MLDKLNGESALPLLTLFFLIMALDAILLIRIVKKINVTSL